MFKSGFAVTGLAIGIAVLGSQALTSAEKAAPESAIVTEIPLKGVRLADKPSSIRKPTVIKTADALGKIPADKKLQAKISKQVDFDRQQLFYFRWEGSGGDKFSYVIKAAGRAKTVTFLRRMGLTDDLAQHARLFVVDKGVKWSFAELK